MRLTVFTPRFNRRRVALVTSKDIGRALARCIVALGREPLPGPDDYEAMMPPTAVYWVRRVLGANLWLWFAFDDERLYSFIWVVRRRFRSTMRDGAPAERAQCGLLCSPA